MLSSFFPVNSPSVTSVSENTIKSKTEPKNNNNETKTIKREKKSASTI